MRLLIVSQYFWPENFRINDLCGELSARGHDVTVLTGLPNYPDGHIYAAYRSDPTTFARFHDADIVRVPVVPRGSSNVRLVLNYLSFVLFGLLLGPWKLRGREFDAIFVFQTSPITSALPALLIGKLKRAPVSMWVLDLWPDTLSAIGIVKSPRALAMVGYLVRFIYRHCALILVQSRAFTKNVARYAGGTDKIRYFPGWAEAVFETNEEGVAPELLPHANTFKVVFAGNIGEAQDFPAIVEAADLTRAVDGLRWIIVGDGRGAAEAMADVRRRGLDDRVIFLGRFPIERMPGFFEGADALLVSLAARPIWSMTIPGKVQSYLASGTPIVGMLDGEGARVIAESGAGLAGPAGDARALADNVVRLMRRSPEERRRMGLAGRDYCAREFDRRALIDRLEEWMMPPSIS
ncbi:glycosyl transferase family 1 [Sphingomonas sp. Leaf412]|uniref:glycosyltransferase family 4 protein n=1 Tax=Sphingomonas sp. Leaf412 TaxID=1736370 RepID=UPI0006F3438E|nr:glycosyltransferase family 4 protein [Sphingomonas sp. Leaf412]KQT31143.1 glycosyl transferase family 1 [Sphingomonas sp. Leaf412]